MSAPEIVKSVVYLTFFDEPDSRIEFNNWQYWYSLQANPNQKAFDIGVWVCVCVWEREREREGERGREGEKERERELTCIAHTSYALYSMHDSCKPIDVRVPSWA